MALVINSNIQSLSAQNSLNKAQDAKDTSMDRLSSGKRINSAADDAAGLAISTKMTSQIKGLNQAMRNANDGISMIQTAEGALDQSQNILQRMRELSVQSANGTYQEGNRTTMNAEVEQLKAELDRIGETTAFNGMKLFNGENDSVSLQIGDQSGQKIEANLVEVSTDTLGVSSKGGVSLQGTDNAITAGDLSINGVNIDPSLASDDTASTAGQASSAIAKMVAINKHSDETGVTAHANENVVFNSVAMADNGTTALAGDIDINGVKIATAYTVGAKQTTTETRAALAGLINEQSELTGVVAIDTGDDVKGIELVASDGRNIELTVAGTLTAGATGLTSGTYEAGLTLIANSGVTEIVIDGGDGSNGTSDLADVGAKAGTYKAGEVSVANSQVVTTGTVAPNNVLEEGDLVINEVTIGAAQASDDKASFEYKDPAGLVNGSGENKANSGIAMAAAINRATEFTGVTAEVNANVISGDSTVAAGAVDAAGQTLDLTLNGQTVTLTSTNVAEDNRAHAVAEINKVSEQTGIVAEDNGTSLTLTAEDGRNIVLLANNTGTGEMEHFGLGGLATEAAAPDFDDASTYTSSVSLKSASEIHVESGSSGNAALEELGFRAGTYGEGADGQYIKDIDISTADGAQDAITAIDNALDEISAARSDLGAVQNRLDFTVENLSNTVENATTARSRIEDTDYAAESANLSRAQVLQQASQTMLAQANSAPQQVLSLLQ